MAKTLWPRQAELHQRLQAFDKNNDNHFSAVEINQVCTELGLASSMDDLKKVIAKIDSNGDRKVDFNELSAVLQDKFEELTDKEEQEAIALLANRTADNKNLKQERRHRHHQHSTADGPQKLNRAEYRP